MAKQSIEFQGHGWGYACLVDNGWRIYHSVNPVWDDLNQADLSTRLLVVHARSAFRNTGIAVENNMPFTDGRSVFAFNGELRGVRIRIEGRIGAEKVYNLIRSQYQGDYLKAASRAFRLLENRTAYVRAANAIVTDGSKIVLASRFNEMPDYFTMRRSSECGRMVISSEPLPGNTTWEPVPQGIYQVQP